MGPSVSATVAWHRHAFRLAAVHHSTCEHTYHQFFVRALLALFTLNESLSIHSPMLQPNRSGVDPSPTVRAAHGCLCFDARWPGLGGRQ